MLSTASSTAAAVAIDSTVYTLPASGALPAGAIPVTLPSAYNPLVNLEQQTSKTHLLIDELKEMLNERQYSFL